MSRRKWFEHHPHLRACLWGSVLFLAAFLPRLAAIDRYVTPDELIWVFRSVQFRQALLDGQWASTLTAGHPGVTTTWLGALAVSGQLALRPSDLSTYQWITHLAWYAPENVAMLSRLYTFLTGARLLVAVVNSLGIVVAFWLAGRLYGRVPALLTALLLAFDPFLVGLSGLLHVDGLLTTFTTLSLLTLALAIRSPQNRPYTWAALSGGLAGFAILSKIPALLLPPFAALFIFLSMFTGRENPLSARLKRMVGQGLSWLAACVLLFFTLFPALWLSPLSVVQQLTGTFGEHAGEALRPSYFLGEITHDPGLLFYPLTLSFRLSPVVLCGLILAVFLITRALWRQPERDPWLKLPTGIFILWPLLFVTAVTQAAQKYDRYALPVVPALIIVAALGWTYLPPLKTRQSQAVSVLAGIQALLLLWAMPYPLTAVNPLLGGTAVARQVMELDWGEGTSAAAHWLATQPDVADSTAVAGMSPALAPFFPGRALAWTPDNLPQAEYIVTTLDSGNVQTEPPVAGAVPMHTIRFNGQDRAVIFRATSTAVTTPPTPLPEPIRFGDAISLQATQAEATPTAVNIALQWQLVQPTDGRYTVKLSLLDETGQWWAGLETPLLNDVYFYPEHWQTTDKPVVPYRLPLPPGLPPSAYRVELALFDADTQAQLPLFAADGAFVGMAQPVGQVQTRLKPEPVSATQFDPPIALMKDWGSLRLLAGRDFPPASVVNGDNLLLDLYWRADDALPPGLQVEVTLGDLTVRQPLSRFDTANWRPGEIIHEKTAVPIPADMPGDVYELRLRPLTADGGPLGEAHPVGQVEVIALDRQFALPPHIPQLRDDRFGEQMVLKGMDVPAGSFTAGETMNLTLYWQVEQRSQQLISTFVHLLAENGQLVAQSDQWPGGLPAHLWAAGQVITDTHTLTLPTDAPLGPYHLAFGLYYPANGLRLPAFDANGRAHPNNQITLPLETAP
ncbi:MAG: glycosyltransferase family 39 protein [Anaerolineae bacterium]|nr:glycosyltransferase family 39 protein [Anaerolineae bacterium]